MGGCCCCASGQADPDRTPIYIYCPQELEDNEPLPISHVTPTAVPVGLLVDTNLATSIPDTYQAPPVPLPYDVGSGRAETVCQNIESCGNKTDNVQTMNPLAVGETVTAAGFEKLDTCEGLKGIECKGKSDSPKVKEGEILKSDDPFSSAMYDEDVCPTCLEEYDKENPRIVTKCEHHFHLSCILEWMERSNTCPICDQIMVIDHTSEE
ncbi:putative E3 ubiquitin-protein ligase RHB1A isoform X1 [Iris pallida]|uniref:RING-type E3 ubiquitin transferase n=1 Tax=Iris pallida TaxID=29817 RepID=A0AAX6G8H8_IRIPA|nr:putative E3 ubiquitin-protein ligase RHB1A isoform X1 [Iris pallida]KAJ6842749.1 putative E3 ubiquitin-protein ligase RHB1A isoform X1 [Iris pallida]